MRTDLNKTSLARLQNTLTPVVGDKSIFDENFSGGLKIIKQANKTIMYQTKEEPRDVEFQSLYFGNKYKNPHKTLKLMNKTSNVNGQNQLENHRKRAVTGKGRRKVVMNEHQHFANKTRNFGMKSKLDDHSHQK